MANTTFTIKKGAVGTTLSFTLSDDVGTVSLTGYTVTMSARKSATSTAVIDDVSCTPDADQVGNKGEGTYTFDATTANIAVGEYLLEFKITDGSNTFYFPTDSRNGKGYGKLIVQQSL